MIYMKAFPHDGFFACFSSPNDFARPSLSNPHILLSYLLMFFHCLSTKLTVAKVLPLSFRITVSGYHLPRPAWYNRLKVDHRAIEFLVLMRALKKIRFIMFQIRPEQKDGRVGSIKTSPPEISRLFCLSNLN